MDLGSVNVSVTTLIQGCAGDNQHAETGMICLLCLITRNNHIMTPDLQSVSTMSVSQTVSGKESTQEDCVCSKVEFWVGGSTLPALKAFLCC